MLRRSDPTARGRPLRRGRRTAGRVGVVAALLAAGAGLVVSGEVAGPPRVVARVGLPAGGDPSPTAAPAVDAGQGTTALAQDLARAVGSGDSAALAALVDPTAAAELTRWRGVARSVKLLGLTGLSFVAGAVTASPPGPPPAGLSQVVTVPVTVRYRLDGWDAEPGSADLTLTAGLRGSRWLLLADPRPAAARAVVDPWLSGEVAVTRTAHVLLVTDPGQSRDAQGLAARLEAAASAVRSVITQAKWNGRVVAYASRAPGFLAAWFGSSAATGTTPAAREPATFSAEVRTQGGVSRMAVTPFLITRDDARSRAVLRHEVSHVALAAYGSGVLPSWLAEGTAEYVAYGGSSNGSVDPVAALARRGLPQATWKALRSATWQPVLAVTADTFYSGSTAAVGDRYTSAWLACLFIAKHYGQANLFALYAAVAAGTGRDAAAAETAGLGGRLHRTRAALVQDVAVFARDLRRNFS